ncbi:MAG: GDP-mannose 4,6-dehydratase [Patescibacteria group bacterium]|nr:GDP-mannose 4,6-dehydratase [Patescibacteria group bacterium]
MKSDKSIILVTGSQGFIGSNLLESLLPYNQIIGINKILDKKRANYIPIKKDILKLNPSEVSGSLFGVIHLAAITDVEYCNNNPRKCFEINVLGTQNVLDFARKKDCKFVYVSTSHVYGRPKKLPIEEDHPRNPNSIYAASKLAGEICCEGYSSAYGMDISIVRLFSVYGPRSPKHLVTSRIMSQLNQDFIKLGNLTPRRDFIYITDAIRAIATVLKKSRGFQSYNVGNGKTYSVLDICNIVKKISKRNIPVRSVKSLIRSNEINEITSDPSKVKKLGWKPIIDIKNGLKMTLQWYESNRK